MKNNEKIFENYIDIFLDEKRIEYKRKLLEIKRFIEFNYRNDDGKIWHSEMKMIYDIIKRKD